MDFPRLRMERIANPRWTPTARPPADALAGGCSAYQATITVSVAGDTMLIGNVLFESR